MKLLLFIVILCSFLPYVMPRAFNAYTVKDHLRQPHTSPTRAHAHRTRPRFHPRRAPKSPDYTTEEVVGGDGDARVSSTRVDTTSMHRHREREHQKRKESQGPITMLRKEQARRPGRRGGIWPVRHRPIATLAPAEGPAHGFPHDTALYGNIATINEYYLTMAVGDARQQFTVQIDTGASSMAVPGVGCVVVGGQTQGEPANCSAVHGLFDYRKSSGQPVRYQHGCDFEIPCDYPKFGVNASCCGFNLTYTDSSWAAGIAFQDRVSIADLRAVIAHFGVILYQSVNFPTPGVDGILGLARPAVGQNSLTDVFNALVLNDRIANIFSMCIGGNGGAFVLGGIDQRFYENEIQYVPLVRSASLYEVEMLDIRLDGISVNVSLGLFNHSYIDSGATVINVHQGIYDAVSVLLIDQACFNGQPIMKDCNDTMISLLDNGNCVELSQAAIDAMPTIQFQVRTDGNESLLLPLSASDYLYQTSDSRFCFGMSAFPEDADASGVVLGDTFLQAFYAIFDRSKERVGFAAVRDCFGPTYGASITAGDRQVANTLESVSDELTVLVTYQTTNEPVDGIPVTFRIVSGGGTLNGSPYVKTNITGYASIGLTLGPTPGLNAVEVDVQGAVNTGLVFLATGKQRFELSTTSVVLLTASAFLFVNWITIVLVVYCIRRRRIQNRKYQELVNETTEGSNGSQRR